MDPRLAAMLDALGLSEIRKDAKYSAALEQQLEYVRAQTYDIKYPELKARALIPLDTSVDPGAETVAYQQWEGFAMARILANYGDDLPLASALVEKFTNPVIGLGDAYDWSIQDLRRSAMSGSELEMRKARWARRGMETRIDDLAATGNAATKMRGFLNHPNATIATAATDGTDTVWVQGRSPAKAPELVLADLYTGLTTIWDNTKQVFQADTVLFSTTEYAHVDQTAYSQWSDKSILERFMANAMGVTNVDSWYKLNTADAAGTGPRIVFYKRDPEVLQLVIPQDFEQFPPQAKNLTFIVPCHARFGGVVVYYPLAMLYMDGV